MWICGYERGMSTASPSDTLPTGETLRAFLLARFPLPPDEQKNEVPTLWRAPKNYAPTAPISDLTLALDVRMLPSLPSRPQPGDETAEVCEERTEHALFLHRPFDLPPPAWADAPVFASHRGLDAHLSVGWNPALGQQLGLQNITELFRTDEKATAHPIGMVGDLPAQVSFGDLLRALSGTFGGMEAALINGRQTIDRFAVMGAMTPALIRQAADAGAQAYLTGQVRDVARNEAAQNKIAVYATGHKRAEFWGLHTLARELRTNFPDLRTHILE